MIKYHLCDNHRGMLFETLHFMNALGTRGCVEKGVGAKYSDNNMRRMLESDSPLIT